jgi:hypothetical protein
MDTNFVNELTPETKEGIERAIWVEKKSIGALKSKMYQNINLVISNYFDSKE